MPVTAAGPEVFVTIVTKFLSGSYDALEETINQMKSFNLNSYPGENFPDFCVSILVDAESLEIYGAFKPEHLGYISCIFEDNSDSRFRL